MTSELQHAVWPIDKFIDYAHNPRKNDHAVEQVAQAIQTFGFKVPVIVKSSGEVVDGHLRLKAARHLGLTEIPVIFADDLTDAQIKAFRISVNRQAELADWDMDLLKLELQELDELGFDSSLSGFLLADLEAPTSEADEAIVNYSRKITSPIYKPTQDKPAIKDLFDIKKTRKLIKEIKAALIPDNEKEFLIFAAYRHIIFNYHNIAEYYAHSEQPTQELMEDSALVIIDFNKAIENGFVVLTNELAEEFTNEQENG